MSTVIGTSSLMAAALVLGGLIHLLPITGLAGERALTALYDLPFDDPSLRVLMRHRALLFGLLGGTMIAAAFLPPWRVPVASVGLASCVGFVVLAVLEGGGNAAVGRVMRADVVAAVPLAVSLIGMACQRP